MIIPSKVMKNIVVLIVAILAFSLAYDDDEDDDYETLEPFTTEALPISEEITTEDDDYEILELLTTEALPISVEIPREEKRGMWQAPLSGPELAAAMKVGTRVLRGDDWSWGNQDGNPPGEGVIVGELTEEKWIRVQWKNGDRNNYRMGYSGKYDLKLADPPQEARRVYFPQVEDSKRRLTEILLNTRQQQVRSVNKWGRHVARIAVSLYLNDQHVFDVSNQTGEEISLELSLQLLSKLSLKKNISTKELSLYINALTVTCFDPKDFYGFNLVEELRKRVNKSKNIHPFSIFTLCNAGDSMTMDDVSKLQMQYDAHIRPVWTDVQAMVVIALSCINSRSELNLDESVVNDMVSELKKKQHSNGTVDDWKITTLVVQALMAADDYQTDFDMNAAIKVIVDDINNHTNIQDIYYALPIFNRVTLANISSSHCGGTIMQTETRESNHPVEPIKAQISVITNDDMDFSLTWKLKVSSNYSLYQALEILGTLEPTYKAQYTVSDGKPYVTGFGNLMDDAESGTYWFLYSKRLSASGTLFPTELSPVDIPLNETHEMILWYRTGSIAHSKKGSEE